MAEHRYSCVLDFGETNDTPKKTEEEKAAEEEAKFEQDLSKQTKALFKRVVIGTAIAETIQWQVSLIGRNQGSSLMQEKINAGLQIAGTVGAIGIAFAKGGVVAGTAALAGVAIKLGKDIEQYNYNARWENIGLSLSRERLGSSAAVNRSRNV